MDPPLAYNHPVTLDALTWLVEGTKFRDQFDFVTPAGPSELIRSLPDLWSLLVDRGTVVLPVLGFVGLLVLVRGRPAFGIMSLAILTTGLYVWANYLRLEHYLLVPSGARHRGDLCGRTAGPAPGALCRPRWRPAVETAIVVGAFGVAIGLAAANWQAADRSGEDGGEAGGEAYVDAMLPGLPQGAAILTPWDASTPPWHATFVRSGRPDLLVIDDTNIVYEGWGSRRRASHRSSAIARCTSCA